MDTATTQGDIYQVSDRVEHGCCYSFSVETIERRRNSWNAEPSEYPKEWVAEFFTEEHAQLFADALNGKL